MAKTVLLIEADTECRGLIAPALARRELIVVEADSGAAGLDAIRSVVPDLLIVGDQLPDFDCLTWISELRVAGVETRVVLLASVWPEASSLRELTAELGVDLVVHKPLIPTALAEQVSALLDGGLSDVVARATDPRSPALSLLRFEYASGLPNKVKELAHAVHQLRTHPTDALASREVVSQSHRLRGTAGSYGFGEVSGTAGLIEALATGLGDLAPAEQARRVVALERRLADVEHAVAEVSRDAESADAQLSVGRVLLLSRDDRVASSFLDQGQRQLVQIIVVSTPEEAIDSAEELIPEAVVLDARSDELDEVCELARKLRSLPGCESLPLAFYTKKTDDIAQRAAAIQAGASLVLEEPVTSTGVARAVTELLGRSRAARPQLMLVDDDSAFALRTAAVLSQAGMSVRVVGDSHNLLEALHEVRPELLLLDVLMPGTSGFDLCRMLRASPQWQDLPIFFITGKTGLETRMAAFRAGGDDYLPKPIVDEELLARVRARLERSRLLRERAECDALTGLMLRRAFLDRLTSELVSAERSRSPVVLCFIDIDGFKAVNDEHGHPAGDRVLTRLGLLLQSSLRPVDLRGRWGGDEFVLAFSGEQTETIERVVDRLRRDFEAIAFETRDGAAFHASFSAGMASYPQDAETVRDMLRMADQRMYADKKRRGAKR